ncbi:MAG: Activator of Hsp90 ATPase 1 family protein [Ignavibacteria bacterium]|nr:MAG: Activator of Hsp90 ATPase 1 family protein [Ignavibacteria bacterium]KAF0161941.1 MAG: Activator of Hsp90 ATPase 1 family protein [Ignavibacteria bacterium]
MKISDEPIIVEQIFNSSIESVWEAITQIELMRKWYFDNIPDFKPEIGFKTKFNVESGFRNFVHKWVITEVQLGKMIKYTWEFEEYSGKSSTTFKLSRQNDLTKLKLTVDVLENFEGNIPEFERESCIEGWQYFINNRLNKFLCSV